MIERFAQKLWRTRVPKSILADTARTLARQVSLKASAMTDDQTTSNLLLQPILQAATPAFETIQTSRLDLLPCTPESLYIQLRNGPEMRAELGAHLGALVTNEWPHDNWEPHVFEYLLNLFAQDAEAIGWCRYLLLRHESGRTLIGSVGCGFPKPETGAAEIGYGILPSWQRQGFAPEAVAAMMPWLESRREVRAFVAQTFPHLRGSIRVLEKSGFRHVGDGFEEGTILFRRECGPPQSEPEQQP